jgi:diguanylate cyclase (GGDEF)-like protein/PAS domain S-box-containing protein
MRLRTQILIGVSGLLAILGVLLFGVVSPYVRSTFATLEDAELRQDVARAKNAICAELASLESTADDWGAWEDTASFVRGEAPGYVEKSLPLTMLANLRLHFMVFFDQSGQTVFSRGFDVERSEEVSLSDAALAALRHAREGLRPPSEVASYAAVLDLDGVYGLVAFHPILNNQHELPSSGTVAVGRLLDAAVVRGLSSQVQLPLSIHRLGDPGLPAAVAAGTWELGEDVVRPLDEQEVAGYALWPETGGVPAVVSFVVPRTVFQAGQRTLRYLTATFVTALAALGVGVLLFVNYRVLSRTSRLTTDVTQIAESKNPTARVAVEGRDELAGLGRHINRMLASIEDSRAALERSEKRYRNLFESSPDPIYITTLDGAFIDVNQALLDLFGYPRDELMVLSAGALYARSGDREEFRTAIRKRGFVASYPVALRKKHGTIAECLLTSIVEDAPDGTGLVYQGIIRDVTEVLQQQEKLEYLATHDPLTGLLTRGALYDLLSLEIASSTRSLGQLAIFYLDLDRFKEVNDALGHAAGDRLLQQVAERLREALRASDVVARLGGDEFVALLPNIRSPFDAETVADKILHALRDAFHVDGHHHDLSASIGIALFPDDGENGAHLLQKADAAMYAAKAAGRDGWRRYGHESPDPSPS